MFRSCISIVKAPGLSFAILMACATFSAAQHVTPTFAPGTWSALTNTAPAGARVSLLLSDGRIMVLENGSGLIWHIFSPDRNGSYINGTWGSSTTSPSPGAYPQAVVLNDGRVYTIGGHNYNTNMDTNAGAIYDPATNAWSTLSPPANGSGTGLFATVVLSDGEWMVQNNANKTSAILNPRTMIWHDLPGHGKADANTNESYTLLPDGTVFTVDTTDTPNSERWLYPSYYWVGAGSSVVTLAFAANGGAGMMGPVILRPDGTVFAAGGCQTDLSALPDCIRTAPTAIYTPPSTRFSTGTWVAGSDFPTDNGYPISATGGPAAILPDGNVLIFASKGFEDIPAFVYEFDGSNLHGVPDIPNAMNDASSFGNMLVLPTGQVWFTDGFSDVEIYTPAGTYETAWQPTITSVPTLLKHGSTNYKLTGTQLNGVSQGSTSSATNYPLVRIKNKATAHVVYCKTRNFSTRGVATGSASEFTYFEVPANIETGASQLVVVANGIPSNPVDVIVY